MRPTSSVPFARGAERRRGLSALAAAAALVAGFGCGGADRVGRVLGGDVIYGAPIESDAYAAFLLGALAEGDGDLALAERYYLRAAAADAAYAAPFASAARVACRRGDGARAAELGRAAAERRDGEARDIGYVGYEDGARCAASRPGGEGGAREPNVARSASLEASEQAFLAAAPSAAALLDAAQLARRSRRVFRAVDLVARAAVRSATAVDAASDFAVRLARAGELAAARALAARLVDAHVVGMSRRVDQAGRPSTVTTLGPAPSVAVLAVDEAIVQDDHERALARATAMRMPFVELAGRALLHGADELALRIAERLPRSADEACIRELAGTTVAGAALAPVDPTLRLAVLVRTARLVAGAEDRAALAEAARRLPLGEDDALVVDARRRLSPAKEAITQAVRQAH